jgi:DNA (cytosine-5)-methyltransferase 1
MSHRTDLSAISLFSGAGGMDIGFMRSGFRIVAANEIDKDACQTYATNHPEQRLWRGDVQEYLAEFRQFEGVDLVFGGPPCQGFSVAGKMDPQDSRNQLLWTFMQVVEMIQPRAFVCENVKALAVLEKWSDIRQKLCQIAQSLGYTCKLVLLNAADFGVPQSRDRMFLIGFRDAAVIHDLEGQFEQRRRLAPTVRDILLPLGVAGSPNNQRTCSAKVTIAAKPVMRRSPYAGMLFNGQGRPLNPARAACSLHASMGGNKTPIIDEAHCYFGAASWVEWYHQHLLQGGQPLAPNAAPKHLRRLTVDEALRIQTFPHNYRFIGSQCSIYRQIGNAVPCELAEVVADVVRDCLIERKLTKIRRSTKQLQLT